MRSSHETSELAPFIGRWDITGMEMWDLDAINELVTAHLTIEPNGSGVMQFILVDCFLQVSQATHDDNEHPAILWTWEGNDEMDAASGVGSAVLQPDGTLAGTVRFHGGDESAFTAERVVT